VVEDERFETVESIDYQCLVSARIATKLTERLKHVGISAKLVDCVNAHAARQSAFE
jgi:hypothetical protein